MNTTQQTILTALERQPMTPQQIASSLSMNYEKVRANVSRLFNKKMLSRQRVEKVDGKSTLRPFRYSVVKANPASIAPARAGSEV